MLKPTIALSIILAVNSLKSYENFVLIDVVPHTENHLELLRNLQSAGFDFWTNTMKLEHTVRILVSPADRETVSQMLEDSGISFVISVRNVQDLINRQIEPAITRMRYSHGSFTWNKYHSLENIYSYLVDLPNMYPDIVKLITIGHSFDRLPIYVVVVDFKQARIGDPPKAVIEGGAHAREWLSPATVTWILKEILTSTDEEVNRMAKNFIWHFIPVLNPDGYKYTFTDDRLWKKNRNTAYYKPCSGNDNTLSNGVDLNRNFEFGWNKTLYDTGKPCSLFFAGNRPYSEPESLAFYSYVMDIKGKIIYYFSFHSYGQYILVPYSHLVDNKTLYPPDDETLVDIATSASNSLRQKFGTLYKVGHAPDIMFPLTGTSFDTFKNKLNASITYLFKLRDQGLEGYLIQSSEIIPNNLEIMDAILEIDRQARKMEYYVPINGSFRFLCSVYLLLVCNVLALLY